MRRLLTVLHVKLHPEIYQFLLLIGIYLHSPESLSVIKLRVNFFKNSIAKNVRVCFAVGDQNNVKKISIILIVSTVIEK